jgi:hypothetical protein
MRLKSEQLVEKLLKELQVQHRIRLQLAGNPRGEEGENFSISSWRDTFYVKAYSSLGASYALSQLKTALQGNSRNPWLQDISPGFSQRWLWLVGKKKLACMPGIGIDLPEELLEKEHLGERVAALAERLISLGFNGIIFGAFSSCPKASSHGEIFQKLIEELRSFHIKVAIKLSSETSFSQLTNFLKRYSIDALLWESRITKSAGLQSREAIQDELHLEELLALEKIAGKKDLKLLYSIAACAPFYAKRQPSLLAKLADDAGLATSLVFPSSSNHPTEDFSSLNPFFNTLYQREVANITPLLPIVNMGSVGCGAGLWPSIPLDLLTGHLPKNSSHAFDGAIILSESLPTPGTFLDAALWLAGHTLFFPKIPMHQLIAIWLAAHHPATDKEQWQKCITYNWQAIQDTLLAQKLYQEGAATDSLFSFVERALANLQISKSLSGLSDSSMRHFYSDICRILSQALQGRYGALHKRLSEVEEGFGFWTSESWLREKKNLKLSDAPFLSHASSKEIFAKTNIFSLNNEVAGMLSL